MPICCLRFVKCYVQVSFLLQRGGRKKLYLNLHESEIVLENILGISFTCPEVKIFLLVNKNEKTKEDLL